MEDTIDRPLKELLAAVFHDHQKHDKYEIRADQEHVLNRLLDQPETFRNKVELKPDGLVVYTQRDRIEYRHDDNLDKRKILKKAVT